MILTVDEYKQKIKELQSQLTENMTLEWASNAGWIDQKNVPNFRVIQREEENGFSLEATAFISVRIEKNDRIHLDFYPSDVDSTDFFPHVQNMLEKQKQDILSFVDGYIQ